MRSLFALSLALAFTACSPPGNIGNAGISSDVDAGTAARYPSCNPAPGEVRVTGSLDGVSHLTAGSDAGMPYAIVTIVDTTSDETIVQPGDNLTIYLTAEQDKMLRLPYFPARVTAAGAYKASCKDFYNWGQPCFTAGACVEISYRTR